jgi:hypothetical protein
VTRVAVLDDHLLLLYLAGHDQWLSPDHQVATTASWWFRLARARARQGGGSLSALIVGLSGNDRDRLQRDIRRLPGRITVAHPRRVVPHAAVLSDRHRLNHLAAEALATAVALDGRIVVAANDDGPRLRASAAMLDVPYNTVEP